MSDPSGKATQAQHLKGDGKPKDDILQAAVQLGACLDSRSYALYRRSCR